MNRTVLVFAIAAWSGFFVMAVELLGGRILAPTFGNSIYVWGGIITVFMLALSVGYLAGGYLSLYAPSLRRLGLLMIGAALATVPVLVWSNSLLEWLFDHVRDPRYASLVGASLLFFVPTAICGTLSPYAVRLLVRQIAASGKSAGALYFYSTFGSAAGTIVTSFYLVALLEIDQILAGLIAVSLTLGMVAVVHKEKSVASQAAD